LAKRGLLIKRKFQILIMKQPEIFAIPRAYTNKTHLRAFTSIYTDSKNFSVFIMVVSDNWPKEVKSNKHACVLLKQQQSY
jgi:hypothetical protein